MRKNNRMRGARQQDRRRGNLRAAFLALIAVFLIFAMSACNNWELEVYRTLAISEIRYEGFLSAATDLHEAGQMDDRTYAQSIAIAERIDRTDSGASKLLIAYRGMKDPVKKKKIEAALAELPGLSNALARIVFASRSVAPGQGAPFSPSSLTESVQPKLLRAAADLDEIETLRIGEQ